MASFLFEYLQKSYFQIKLHSQVLWTGTLKSFWEDTIQPIIVPFPAQYPGGSGFLSLSLFIFLFLKKICICLTLLGLSCGMWDLVP